MTAQTAPKRIFTLASASREIGRSDSTIRRAEADGRLAAPRRDEFGHRFYNNHDLERLRLLLGRSED